MQTRKGVFLPFVSGIRISAIAIPGIFWIRDKIVPRKDACSREVRVAREDPGVKHRHHRVIPLGSMGRPRHPHNVQIPLMGLVERIRGRPEGAQALAKEPEGQEPKR